MRSFRLYSTVTTLLLTILCGLGLVQAQEATVTTVAVSSATVVSGAAVKMTATVTAGGVPVHPGLITFCDATAAHCEGSALLGSAQLTATGVASVSVRLGIGAHNVKAVFAGAPHGTPATAPSTSAAKSVVVQASGKIPTVTILNSAGSTGAYSFTGYVTSFETPAIGGTLTFTDQTDGSVTLGTSTLSGIKASALFASAPSAPVGDLPFETNLADFNGDGIPDLAVANNDGMSVTILLGNGDGSFTVKSTIPISGYVVAVATADFNSDGNADLIVSSDYPFYQTVLLGNGDGTFLVNSTPSSSTTFVDEYAVGDFNGDGIPDIVSYDYDSVNIALGVGDGTFYAGTSLTIPEYVDGLVVADFNGDGIPDLAVAINPAYTADTLEIFIGNGDGTFKQAASPATGQTAGAITAADFNGDGIPDLAVCDSATVYILIGKGDGTFTEKTLSVSSGSLSGIKSADFNGDGIADLLLTLSNSDTDNIEQLFFGKGDGTFTAGPSLDLGGGGGASTVADFNGDGIPDIASPDGGEYTVDIYLGQQMKSFTLHGVAISSADLPYIVASYSGDSFHDPSSSGGIATGNATAAPVVFPGSGVYPASTMITITDATPGASIYYAINPSYTFGAITNFVPYTGPFQLPAPSSPTAQVYLTVKALAPGYVDTQYTREIYQYAPASVTTLQLNTGASVPLGSHVTLAGHVTVNGVAFHEGVVNFCDADVAYCENSALLGSATLQPGGWAVVHLLLGAGVHHIRAEFQGISGQKAAYNPYQPTFSAPSASAVETVTVVGQSATATQAIVATQADGKYSLSSGVSAFGRAGIIGTLAFRDSVNGAKAVLLGSVTLEPSNSVFQLAGAGTTATGNTPVALAVADLNQDGIPDLVTANDGGSSLSILYGRGDGTFTPGASIPVGADPTFVTVADINDDGIPDLIVTCTAANSISIFLGATGGSFSLTSTKPTPAGPSYTIVGDFNGDGSLDVATVLTGSNAVMVYLGDNSGYLQEYSYSVTVPSTPVALVAADFNGDSVLDLATSNADGSVSILLGTIETDETELVYGSNFAFSAAFPLLPGASGQLVTGDFNHDGIPDLAVPAENGINVYLGNGDGTFKLKATLPASGILTLNVADFNADGFSDIAVTEKTGAQDQAVVFLNAGDGTFPKSTTLVSTALGGSTAVADLNGDGLPDLVAVNPTLDTVGVLLGSQFTPATLTGVTLTKPGTHQIYADYSGSSTYKASAGRAISITVPSN